MTEFFHRKIERNTIGFVLGIVAVASIGGFVEIGHIGRQSIQALGEIIPIGPHGRLRSAARCVRHEGALRGRSRQRQNLGVSRDIGFVGRGHLVLYQQLDGIDLRGERLHDVLSIVDGVLIIGAHDRR